MLLIGGANGNSAPVLASSAATRERVWPSTCVKTPPTNNVEPSADATTARTSPFRVEANEVMRLPVVMSYASRFVRTVSFEPRGEPAGRAFANLPPA